MIAGGAPLHAAYSGGDAGSDFDYSAARTLKEARNSRRSTAAGSRRVSGGCRRLRRSCTAGMVPLRGVPHRIAHRRGVRGTRLERTRRQRASHCSASPATRRTSTRASADFLRREASATLETASGACRRSRRDRTPRGGARSVEPLGLVLDRPVCCRTPGGSSSRRQLRAQLSRCARGRAPRRG